jgi:hypothetical protein
MTDDDRARAARAIIHENQYVTLATNGGPDRRVAIELDRSCGHDAGREVCVRLHVVGVSRPRLRHCAPLGTLRGPSEPLWPAGVGRRRIHDEHPAGAIGDCLLDLFEAAPLCREHEQGSPVRAAEHA